MRSVTGVRAQWHPRLKARRGAIVMIAGLLFIGMVAIAAMSIDMSRLGVLRAELQVAADAGAHAGAVQYSKDPLNTVAILDSARSYAQRNTALQVVPTIDIAEMGVWNSVTSTFTPGLPNPNAVRVQVSVQSAGLIMTIVGVDPPLVHATAIGSTAVFPSPPPPTARPVLVK
jgi:uncharacterized membrane protein